jgi:hypothetical protein
VLKAIRTAFGRGASTAPLPCPFTGLFPGISDNTEARPHARHCRLEAGPPARWFRGRRGDPNPARHGAKPTLVTSECAAPGVKPTGTLVLVGQATDGCSTCGQRLPALYCSLLAVAAMRMAPWGIQNRVARSSRPKLLPITVRPSQTANARTVCNSRMLSTALVQHQCSLPPDRSDDLSARYSPAAINASPLSASFRLCRCLGDSVSTTSNVGLICASRRCPPIAMPSARLTTT